MIALLTCVAVLAPGQDRFQNPAPPGLHRPSHAALHAALPPLPQLVAGVPLLGRPEPAGFATLGQEAADEVDWCASDALLAAFTDSHAWLEARGATVDLVHVHDLFHNSGGIDDGVRQSRFLDLAVGLDGEQLFGLGGSTFFVDAYATGGSGVGELVGDLQGVSNIEAAPDAIVAEVWWEQWLLGESLRTKVGKIDGNSEFAFSENAGGFLNSSMGFSPTTFVLPTFPDPAIGGLLEYRADAGFALRLGLFDGAGAEGVRTGELAWSSFFGSPTDLFLVGEVEARWGADSNRPGRAVVGVWEHNGEFTRFAGGVEDHTRGTFATVDQSLPNPLPTGNLAGWLMLGEADEAVSEIAFHAGAGLVWSEFLAGRDDSLGLGASLVHVSDEAGFADEHELVFELYWRTFRCAWLQLVPDVQYVVNPGADGTTDDALVIGVRAELVLH
jgi:porin